MKRKNMYFKPEDVDKWEKYCEQKFKSKRVMSKVMTEAMEEFIQNNPIY